MSETIPRETLRMLGVLLVVVFDHALETGRAAIEKLRPVVEPPEDLRVVSTTGCLYSGLIVVDRGEVLAGVVVATGYDPVRAIAGRSPVRTPTSVERWPGPYDDEEPPWRR